MIKSFLQSRLLQAIAQQQGKITAADVKFAKMVVATAFLDSGGVVPEPGTSFDIMQITDAQHWALYKVFGDTASVTDLVAKSLSKPFSETAGATDSSILSVEKALLDSTGVTDAVTLAAAYVRSF